MAAAAHGTSILFIEADGLTVAGGNDEHIMAFVKSGLGVTISQEMVLHAFARDVVSVPLVPESFRTIGLAFAKTNNSVVARTLLEYCRSGATEST